jgi:SAM-dependent methyltransferase
LAVIGDGDGRLARAARAKLGGDARICVIEPRVTLHKYLADFEDVGTDPWDPASLRGEVQKHGLFDVIIFYGLHEYLHGHLWRFQQVVAQSKPNGILWVTFVNASALRYLVRELPPLRLAADALATPNRYWDRIDYASWMAYAVMLNSRIESVWGLFDHASFQFCENPEKSKTADWEIKGAKIQANTAAEIVHWGAAYLGIQLLVKPDSRTGEDAQALGGAAFNPHLFQSLVDPFPESRNQEAELAWAETEIRSIRVDRESLRPSLLIEFLLGLIDNPDAVGDVLVLGAGWGRDVFMIKKARPQWRCVGVELSKELVLAGKDFRDEEGIQVENFQLGEALPFADKSFDVIVSLGFMSSLYDQAALVVVKELLRVGRKGIYHLEDARGPEEAPKLKQNAVPALYGNFERIADPKPILIKGKDSGFLFYKVGI